MVNCLKSAIFTLFLLFINSSTSYATITSLSKIKNEKTFDKLASYSVDKIAGNIKEVKVVYEISSGNLYFVNTKQYKFHFEFCKDVLKDKDELYTYRKKNYSKLKDRKYYLASLVYFQSKQTFALEFIASDLISAQEIITCYNSVKSNFFADKIYIIPPVKTNFSEVELKQLHLIKKEDLFYNKTYQPIVKKEAVGILTKVKLEDLDLFNSSSDKILVINGTPLDLPVAAGIITTDFQTPLSHVSVLAFNRRIPLMAYKNAWNNTIINQYINKKVKLSVTNDTFFISPVEKEKAKTPIAISTKDTINLSCDLTVRSLIDAHELSLELLPAVGGKAANFGELYTIFFSQEATSIQIPQIAFAIPFYFYNQHIQNYQIDTLINQLLKNNGSHQPNHTLIKTQLRQIREKILSTALDTAFLVNVRNKVALLPEGRARFRSSTNAEDIEGFGGAGLYTSKTGILNQKDKSIETAIKEVWASLWSDKAFLEREIYGIDQRKVAMGMLVHQSFPDEIANGVAVTKNLLSDKGKAYTINVQKGELSVVQPSSNRVCDQVLAEKNGPKHFAYQYYAHSNQNNGEPVLTVTELDKISNGLQQIETYYKNKLGSTCPLAFDVEFKVIKTSAGTTDVYFKQVRPFNF